MPFMGTIALIFSMASLGLPGLGNFIAEFLTLVGAWQSNPVLTIFATIGLVAATAYSLRIMQKIFYGPLTATYTLTDLSVREKVMMVPLVAIIVWLGVFPQPVLDTSRPIVESVLQNEMIREATTKHSRPEATEILSSKGGPHE
jgi:NADH-quinone oxidoreductase subunit M